MRFKQLLLYCLFYQSVHGSATTTTEKVDILTAEYITEDGKKPTLNENIDQDVNLEVPMRSITDLVLQQTETIKKIISEQQLNQDYPNVTKQEVNVKEDGKNKQELEKDSIEALKNKCQDLGKIFNSVAPLQSQNMENGGATEEPRVADAFSHYTRSDLLRFKPRFPSPPPINMPQPPRTSGNYFIFTQNPAMYGGHRVDKYSNKMDTAASNVEETVAVPSPDEYEDVEEEDALTTPTTTATATFSTTTTTTTEAATKPQPQVPKLKYVRLEPITLKKVLLPSGETSLFWYRFLPITQSFVQIPDTPVNEDVKVVAQPQSYSNEVTLPAQYHYYVDPQSGVIKPNAATDFSASSTTSTTTATPAPAQPSNTPQVWPQLFIHQQTGTIYQSALPHQFIYHKLVPQRASPSATPTTTTLATTTSTTTTTEEVPMPEYTIEIPHSEEAKPAHFTTKQQAKHEFRFVLPMVITGTQDEVSNYPYQLDPYAYLPKGQRPETMNVPVPYVPNYHMIRKLTIPHQLQAAARTKEAHLDVSNYDSQKAR